MHSMYLEEPPAELLRIRHKDPFEKVRHKCDRVTLDGLDSDEVVHVDNALLFAGTADVANLRAFAQDGLQARQENVRNGKAPVNGLPVREIGYQRSFDRIDIP
ncbi:hypothetical protein FIBSPDRAFT_1046114 [Athelia psychrophila]|uniref:Uncharacterized protein n=1 Tax=Athelia psychrophila TaxID=1759441 RepID=A0A166H9C7_9AGAM|nr:hypothetical protein FIBSPDRAFT_1046114 [Fibularhizoctonia sp. CBS 109695]